MKNQPKFAIVLGAFALIMSQTVFAENNSPSASAVYLFLNEKDQDFGCQAMYSIFENSKAQLPKGVKTGRLDVNDKKNESIFKKFDVRILPTVLFVNEKGEVTKRIVGEGSEVQKQLKDAFNKTNKLIGK